MHLNLLLCQSHTPLSTSSLSLPPPLFPFLPPPFSSSSSSTFPPSPPPLPIFTIHPHQSSASFLLSPLCSPTLSRPPPPLPLRQTAGRKWCGIRPELPEPNAYCISVYYPGLAQVAARSCICIFMSSKLGHWCCPPLHPPKKVKHSFCRPK